VVGGLLLSRQRRRPRHRVVVGVPLDTSARYSKSMLRIDTPARGGGRDRPRPREARTVAPTARTIGVGRGGGEGDRIRVGVGEGSQFAAARAAA